ncbi:MAG: hypothetical protein IPO22_13250 [Anaerolineales bacterium]|nr:hypothetical protein [Anaerolineales bacterium]
MKRTATPTHGASCHWSLLVCSWTLSQWSQANRSPLKNATAYIFWGMTLGAFGLVLGPWLGGSLPTVAGLVLHISATVVLLEVDDPHSEAKRKPERRRRMASSLFPILDFTARDDGAIAAARHPRSGPIESTAPQA